MRRFLLHFVLWSSLGSASLLAQGLEVRVEDAKTQEALIGIPVQVGALVVLSDENGLAVFEGLELGRQRLLIEAMGYETREQRLEIEAGKTLYLKLALQEAAILLQTSTVTSSRFEKPLSEVTVSLEVVSPKLLENTNSVSVADVLDRIPGVSMLDDQVDIRGGAGYAQGTGSRVLILMDDLPILQADAGLAQWRDLPTENISQIEVLKGAASALYGSAAMNGIINIRTAYPTSEKPYAKISLFNTFFDAPANPDYKWWTRANAPFERGLQAAYRQRFGKWDLVAGGNLFFSSGYMRGMRTDTFFGPLDTLPNYENSGRITLNTRYRHSERLIFGLQLNANLGQSNRHLFWTRTRGGNLYEASQEAIPIRGRNLRFTIDPSVTYYDNASNRHRVQARFFYIDNDNENQQSNSSQNFFGEYQFQRRFKNLGNLDLVAGALAQQNRVVAEVYGGEAFSLANYAAYLQLERKFFERLTLSAGFRYEYNILNPGPDSVRFGRRQIAAPDQAEGKPILRFGANYQLSPATFLRASYGQAYRFPTLLEKYVSTSAGVLGVFPNPELQSETGESWELAIKQGFKLGKWQGFTDLAFFQSIYRNMLEFQFSPRLFGFNVENVGDTRIRGLEFSLAGQGKLGPLGLDLIGGYTYIDPIFLNFDSLTQENSSSEENVLKYRFRHSLKLDAQLSYEAWGLGLTGQYFSAMEAIDNYLQFNFPTIRDFREEHQGGTYLWHLRASYAWRERVKVSFLVQNLSNRLYTMRPGLLEAPRHFSLRLDLTL